MFTGLKRVIENARRTDISITMNLPVLQELRLFQTRNQSQDPCLLSEPQMILEAHKAVRIGQDIFLTQLDSRVWLSSSSRNAKSYRFHRPKSKRVNAAPREFFYRQACLKPAGILETLERYALRINQLIVKARVLEFVKWAIEIVITTLIVSRGTK